MVVTRTGHCHPLAIADTTPPLPHAKSPFVALDGKLLFVRRLRGEFSDDETPIISNEIRLRFETSPGKGVVRTPWPTTVSYLLRAARSNN